MWFSGLRGGVAFALASVSYGDADFPQHCGGLTPEVAKRLYGMECELDDSTAMLQTTIVIAAFTIFVFGGTITDVAKASGILTDTSPEGIRLAKKEVSARKLHRHSAPHAVHTAQIISYQLPLTSPPTPSHKHLRRTSTSAPIFGRKSTSSLHPTSPRAKTTIASQSASTSRVSCWRPTASWRRMRGAPSGTSGRRTSGRWRRSWRRSQRCRGSSVACC